MKKITKLILASSLLIASTLSFAADNNYRYEDKQYNDNDWSDTPWGQNNSSRNRNSNNNSNSMPWGGNSMMPLGNDNPFWDKGSSAWRDWDTNKWGGNGMPWGGDSMPWGGNNMMPWGKDKKHNKNRDYRGYARPYNRGYGNPYPYQGGGYGNPYNTGPAYPPPPGFVPAPVQ